MGRSAVGVVVREGRLQWRFVFRRVWRGGLVGREGGRLVSLFGGYRGGSGEKGDVLDAIEIALRTFCQFARTWATAVVIKWVWLAPSLLLALN